MTDTIINPEESFPDEFHEQESAGRSTKLSRIMRNIKQFASISELMRISGAIIMIASMSLFLVQGWTEQNDIQRYLSLLTQTGLIAGAGLLLSLLLKEYKGARMFFGLSLVSIPANFSVIGALFLSAFNIDAITSSLPGFAKWVVVDGSSIGLVAIGALAVLLPIALFGFRIMARRSATRLSIAFLALNGLLLVPVRSGLLLSAVFIAAITGAFLAERWLSRNDDTLTTPGGVFSRVLLFVPALMIFFRSAGFYQTDLVLNLLGSGTIYFLARHFSSSLEQDSVIAHILKYIQALAGFGGAFLAMHSFDMASNPALNLGLMNLVLGLMLVDYQSVKSSKLAAGITLITTALISSATVLSVIFNPTLYGTMVAIGTGLLLLGFGIVYGKRLISMVGSVVLIAAMFSSITNFAEFVMQSGWIGLGIAGGLVIVGGSLLDRYGATVKMYLTRLPSAKAE